MRAKNKQPPLGKPLNRNHPLTKGMIGCWLLNEGGGMIAIDSITNQSGTLQSGASFKVSQNGQCVNFNGTSGYIAVPNLAAYNFGTGTYTVSAWYQTTNPGATALPIFSKGGGGSVSGYEFQIGATNKLGLITKNVGANAVTCPALTTNANNGFWQHGVLVYTQDLVTLGNNNVTLYQNGVDVTGVVTRAALPLQSTSTPKIGAIAEQPAYFNGMLQSVMIWNRGLSTTEVRQLYTQPYAIFK